METAVIEAIAWLEAQGLLVPARDSNGDNGWRMLSRRARRFAHEAEFEACSAAQVLPKGLLHARIRDRAWLAFVRGSYATAVFEAMREVEIAVRDAAGFVQGDLGVRMIRQAFHKDTGPLTDAQAEEGEKEAISSLFAGAIGSYKNPHSHRHVALDDPREAAEVVVLASHLLHIVDARAAARAS